jgi:hypothetical protein
MEIELPQWQLRKPRRSVCAVLLLPQTLGSSQHASSTRHDQSHGERLGLVLCSLRFPVSHGRQVHRVLSRLCCPPRCRRAQLKPRILKLDTALAYLEEFPQRGYESVSLVGMGDIANRLERGVQELVDDSL